MRIDNIDKYIEYERDIEHCGPHNQREAEARGMDWNDWGGSSEDDGTRAAVVRDTLIEILMEKIDNFEQISIDIDEIVDYREDEMLTSNEGFTLKTTDGAEFQISIVKSK